MKNLFVLFSAFCIFIAPGIASADGANANFKAANEAYLAKNYDEASKLFRSVLDSEPNSISVLVNLGLSEFQLKQNYLAIAHLRKALDLDPSNSTASAGLKYVIANTQIPKISVEGDLYHGFTTSILDQFSLGALFICSLLLFILSGWLWVKYFGVKKHALQQELQRPPAPIPATIMAAFFVIFVALFGLKINDQRMPRGTIVIERTNLQTAPGDDQVVISEVFGGMEVFLIGKKDNWAQIKVPGANSGWIKLESIVMTR